jgi:hypothetical protein
MTPLVCSRNILGFILDPQGPSSAQAEETFEPFTTNKRGHSKTRAIDLGHLVIELLDQGNVLMVRETAPTSHVIGMKKVTISNEGVVVVLNRAPVEHL